MADNNKVCWNSEVSIVLGGEAGQGIQSIEYILGHVLRTAGYNVFSTSEFMSRIRGGCNTTQIRVSSKKVAAFTKRIDILVAFGNDVVAHLGDRVTNQTIILCEPAIMTRAQNPQVIEVPFSNIALEVGNKIYANTVAAGLLAGLFNIDLSLLQKFLTGYFSTKTSELIDKNLDAAQRGHIVGSQILQSGALCIDIPRDAGNDNELFMTGADSVGIGALPEVVTLWRPILCHHQQPCSRFSQNNRRNSALSSSRLRTKSQQSIWLLEPGTQEPGVLPQLPGADSRLWVKA